MLTVIAVVIVGASIGIVGWPLFKGIGGASAPKFVEDMEVSETLAQKDATLLAISELESDYEMGNLSRNDYQELRKKYDEKALALMKTADELRSERGLDVASELDEEIEARVSELRSRKSRAAAEADKSCSSCGAQVQSGDVFCFRCGAALSLECPNCSNTVGHEDRFCARCGAELSNTGNE